MAENIPSKKEASARVGVPVDAALFSRVEQLIQRVRLIQDGRIAVETGSVASDVHVARKEFEMNHFDQSLKAVTRVSAAFDQKVTQWENLARRKELQKQNLSMEEIRKMRAEHTGVRTRVQSVRAQIRTLSMAFDQLGRTTAPEAAEPESDTTEVQTPAAESNAAGSPKVIRGPRQLPQGFLEAFQAAQNLQGRSKVVRQYFEVDAKLDVEIRRDQGRDRAFFSPHSVPPINRFYFLLDTAQILRARRAKIVDAIHIQYPDTGKSGRMPLKEFIGHVRKGVWLLRPKTPDASHETAGG